jgi:DNA replication factor GINS
VEVKITYEVLFDVLRREKENNELQSLDDTFYDDVADYIAKKRQNVSGSTSSYDGLDDEKDKIQLRNILRTVEEIYNIRERKVLGLARRKARSTKNLIDTTKLLPEERSLFDDAVSLLEDQRVDVLGEMKGKIDQPHDDQTGVEADEDEDSVTVEIQRQLPKFLGTDKNVYGPFDEGQEVELPESVAELLVKKGRAERADA